MADQIPLDPHKLVFKLEVLGKKAAHAKAKARLLEAKTKVVLARLTDSYMVTGMSHNAAEKSAYAHEAYSKHLEEWNQAALDADLAKVELDKHTTYIELLRSVNATNREMMKSLGLVS